MTQCTRPGCPNPLNKGKIYCSPACAAKDRIRLREQATQLITMPQAMADAVTGTLGEAGQMVVGEVNIALAENALAVIPFPKEGITYGDWSLSFDGTKDFRPGSKLDYEIVEMMLRSGPVVFAMEMKRAQVFKVFSEGRFKVDSPDKELAEIATAALKLIIPKMAADFTYSAFAYGVSFQEEIWGNKSKYELGLSETKDNSMFTVPFVPNSVKPSTVDYIRRKNNKFDGFVQKKFDANALSGIDEIVVEKDAALVIPFNERFRNLWGESFLKGLYPIWLWYEITLRTMARYLERMAMPVVVARAPSRSSVLIEGRSSPVRAMDLALSLAGNVAKSNAVAIPSDRDENGQYLWDLNYLTATEKGQAFIQVLEFFQQEMIRAGLSADRSLSQSSGGVGSYNIGELHAQASSLTSEMILQQFVYYLNEYFMPSFSLYNRGKNGPPIWLKTQAIDLAERELLMSLIGVAGNAPAGQEFFWEVDWSTLADISNIPRLTEEEMKKRKADVQAEAMDKMEKQQEIMAKNAAPSPKGGASAFPEKNVNKPTTPEPTPVKTEWDEAVDNIFTYQMPWMMNELEAETLFNAGLIGEETYKLFNPFHSRSDGKFTSGPGGAGAINNIISPAPGGSGTYAGAHIDLLAAQHAISQAKSKGSIIKTTGKILGLTGLGLVGFAVLATVVNANQPDELDQYLAAKAEKEGQAQKELDELTKNWPKTNSPEEAAQVMEQALRGLGLDGIPADLAVRVADIPGQGQLGYYDYNNDTLTISPQITQMLQEGNPVAVWAIMHEVAHSNQEVSANGWGDFSGIVDGANNTNYRQFLEGENDLMTGVAMSKMYGQPLSNETAITLSDKAAELKARITAEQTGVTITNKTDGIAQIGYPAESKAWAGIAAVAAQQAGVSPRDYLIEQHGHGMDGVSQHNILVNLFPQEMKDNGYMKDSGERNFPTLSEVRVWMANHGYVDPDKAYEQMIEEASRG